LGFRKVDRDGDRQKGSRHHEDDEQHEHHVDERRDVDLAHDRAPSPASLARRPRNPQAAGRNCPLNPARRSGATESPRTRRRSPRAAATAYSPPRRTYYRKSSPGCRQQVLLLSQTAPPRCPAPPPPERYSST